MNIEQKLKALDRIYEIYDALAADENRRAYQSGLLAGSGSGLIANQPLKFLMIPPEHRLQAEPLIQKIRSITI